MAWKQPRACQGSIDAFYRGSGEMIRIQTPDSQRDWFFRPNGERPSGQRCRLGAAPKTRRRFLFVRVPRRDASYRTAAGLARAHAVDAPSKSALRGIDAGKLVWFEERYRPALPGAGGLRGEHASDDRLPPAKYAVEIDGEKETVVYSEQCLSRDFCFTWQRWSAALQEAQKADRSVKTPPSQPSP